MSSQEGEDPGFGGEPEPEDAPLSDEAFYGSPAPVFAGRPRWEQPSVDPALELLRGSAASEVPGFEGDLEEELQRAVGLGTDPGLGLLVDLARRGEYDPWNVDIVSVTDHYLEALDETLDARDLQRVARLIFYAAALIHLKARAMAARQQALDYEDVVEQTLLDEFGNELGGPDPGYPRLRPGDEPLDYGFLGGGEDAGGMGGLLSPREKPLRTLLDTSVDSPDIGTGNFTMQPNAGVATTRSGEYVPEQRDDLGDDQATTTKQVGGASRPGVEQRRSNDEENEA